jgi:hypothetical protein
MSIGVANRSILTYKKTHSLKANLFFFAYRGFPNLSNGFAVA